RTHTAERRVTKLTQQGRQRRWRGLCGREETVEDGAARTSDTLERIGRGLAFIEAHLFERPTLGAIADRSATSPWHFHRVFVALTGETPAGYVWKRQLSEICRRLVETRQPLVEVALDCGFESQATFTRAFTRHVGVSPARYRRAGI